MCVNRVQTDLFRSVWAAANTNRSVRVATDSNCFVRFGSVRFDLIQALTHPKFESYQGVYKCVYFLKGRA